WTRHSRGRARLPSPATRWARCASFFSTRLRNKDPAKASKQPGHCGPERAVVTTRAVVTSSRSRRNTLLPVLPIRYEENNNEIHLFGLLRQSQIRWHDRERAKRHVRRMLRLRRPSSRQRAVWYRRSSSGSGNSLNPVLEGRQGGDYRRSLRGNQG